MYNIKITIEILYEFSSKFVNIVTPGSATAGGAGQGSVQNGIATGTGTGVAQAGPGGFGIGLGLGIAVATPLGEKYR